MCSTRYRSRAATKRNILFSKFRSLISPVINQFVHNIESSMTDHEIPEIQTCTVCKISALVLTAVELSRPVGNDNFKCLLAIKCKLPETKYQLSDKDKTRQLSTIRQISAVFQNLQVIKNDRDGNKRSKRMSVCFVFRGIFFLFITVCKKSRDFF